MKPLTDDGYPLNHLELVIQASQVIGSFLQTNAVEPDNFTIETTESDKGLALFVSSVTFDGHTIWCQAYYEDGAWWCEWLLP